MKIIFLDIDGVLVPDYLKDGDEAFSSFNHWNAAPFSKSCMKVLNRILKKTGAKVVISSDWRVNYSFGDMREIFKEAEIYGGEDTVIGFTKRSKYGSYERNRAEEIKEWANIHRPEFWVAIDDLPLSPFLEEDHFVRCYDTNLGISAPGREEELRIKLGN